MNRRDQMVRAAMRVLERDGFEGLSMRSLASRMGIQAASLYNHVANKEELLALVADAICAEVPPLNPKKPWATQLERMALDLRRVLTSHRDGARVLAATPPTGPHRLKLIEQTLSALRSAGFSPEKTVDAASALNSYVVGFVLDENSQAPTRSSKTPFGALPIDQFPTLIALSTALMSTPADRSFALGLRALLDGLSRYAKRG